MTPVVQAEPTSGQPNSIYSGLDSVDRALFQDRFVWNSADLTQHRSPDPTGAEFWYLGSFVRATNLGIGRPSLMSPETLDLSLCRTGTLGDILYVSDHTVTVMVACLSGTNAYYNTLAIPACRPLSTGQPVVTTTIYSTIVEVEQPTQAERAEVQPAAKSETVAGRLRELADLPVRDLATMMGVSERGYNNWLADEPMSVDNERRLLRLQSFLLTIRERGQRPRTWLLTPAKPTEGTRLESIAKARTDQELLDLISAFEVEAASNFAANVARLQEDLLPNPVELSANERANLARRRHITRVRPVHPRNG